VTSVPGVDAAHELAAPRAVVLDDPPASTPPWRHGTRRLPATTLALVACVVAGAALRVWHLGARRLDFDEAFTAMAGRRSLSSLFHYLRVGDSHPPLDYLLHAPLARAGVDAALFRTPSVVCSIAALALFAWWMRRYGFAGVVATALLAVSAFQLANGRTARMYAELELIGVAAALLADAWLRRPRRWHAVALGALVLTALLTHVSGFLLAGGLLALAGTRRDREAWRWRIAICAGGLGWALLWGPSFLVQARGGHSDWIPRTTPGRVIDTFGSLLTSDPRLQLVALAAVAVGGYAVWQRDRVLARVVVCCSLTPAVLAALAGLSAPVLLDRTLTVAAWGAPLAIGFFVALVARHGRVLAAIALVAITVVAVPEGLAALDHRGPDHQLRHLEHVVRPGDIVASRPAHRLPELAWTIGVRARTPYHLVGFRGHPDVRGFIVGSGPPSGRAWVLDWSSAPLAPSSSRCAPDWRSGTSRVVCLSTVSVTGSRVVLQP
jgi:hypothetical protein